TTITQCASAHSRICGYSASRRFSLSFLESSRPAMGRAGSRITAATTTGPAKGPRPASSTPACKEMLPVEVWKFIFAKTLENAEPHARSPPLPFGTRGRALDGPALRSEEED